MGAPAGNTNATKNKVWRDAIRRQVAQFKDKDRGIKMGQVLNAIAKKVFDMGLDGDEFAIREIGNRLDGKPVQVQEIEVGITALMVIETYRARLGNDDTVRQMLKAAGADNLLPVLEQLIIERPKAITYEETA